LVGWLVSNLPTTYTSDIYSAAQQTPLLHLSYRLREFTQSQLSNNRIC